jgi:hypothetical protein
VWIERMFELSARLFISLCPVIALFSSSDHCFTAMVSRLRDLNSQLR